MTVLIDNRTEENVTEELVYIIEKIVADSLAYEEFEEACEISVSIVTDEEIKEINEQFRNIDSPTDVLSFPQLTFDEGEMADVNEKEEIILGDIIISLERAEAQALEYGHSLKREIAFLTAHSMLHLMGYDHMEPIEYDHLEPNEEEEMFAKQKEILEKAGIPR